MTLSAGTRLGPYEIVSPLGAGGMGEVYRAKDTRLGREVAVKVLPETVAGDAERLARFEREARALAALNHPSIVTIYSVEQSEQTRFLAMELVEGDSLDATLAAEGLSLARFFDIAVPLADALSAAHERGIVHRDLKPANVMITGEGRVKVLDFGLAKLGVADSDPNVTGMPTSSRVELTSEGQVFGTVAYMSPEQARGGKVDARSDVFSLGVVLYQMLTGERPFQGASAVDMISSILRDRPSAVTELRTDLPRHLGRVIRRCLEKDPRDRYQTSRDVYNELRDLREETASTPAPPLPSVRLSSPTGRSSGRPRDEELWVAVLPFKSSGSDPEIDALAEGLSQEVTTGLSRFSYLHVIAHASTLSYRGRTVDPRTVGRELGARYLMEGGVRKAGSSVRVAVQLVDASTGAQLWARNYDRDIGTQNLFALQDEITGQIVSTSADTYGVLTRSMGSLARSRPAGSLSPYEAVLRGFAYWQLITAEEHSEVRACLERAVELEPGYADAWASLSLMYLEEHKHDFNPRPDSLGRALSAARRAIELDPACQQGYVALAQTQFFRKDFGAFRIASDRAIALNPLDGSTVAMMGILMAYTGDWGRGLATAERALHLNPHHPGWYRFAEFWERYRKGEYAEALEVVEKISMPSYFYTHVVAAAVNGQLGRAEAARAALDELAALVPDFASKAYVELGKWASDDLVDQLVDGLRKAGMEIPSRGAPAGPVVSPAAEAQRSGPVARALWIAVLPFQTHTAGADVESFAEGVADEITTGLSRFRYLSVVARASAARLKGQAGGVRERAAELGARYVLEGSVRKAGSAIRVNVQLIDVAAGTQLWAESYDRDLETSGVFAAQDDVAARVVATVADSYGVLVRSMTAALQGKDDAELTASEWMFQLFAYRQQITLASHAALEKRLELAVKREARNSDLWACLAQLYLDEYSFGFGADATSLDRALSAARRAVELDRANQFAVVVLAQVYFFRQDLGAFRPAAEQAMALNPLNTDALGILGLELVHTREFKRGSAIVRRAMELNPNHAGWYHFAPIWEHFERGEYERALEHAMQVNMPSLFWQPLVIAAIYGHLGRRAECAAAVRDLLAIDPGFAAHARRDIAAWHFASGLLDRIVDGLGKAGLDVDAAKSGGGGD
jgi:TolB-like protein